LCAKVLVADLGVNMDVIAQIKRCKYQSGAIALVPWSVALLAVAALVDLNRLVANAAR